ncbi:DMT family transporter [Bacillus sp. USDA818B3_A]|uniref:EamA family transporter n=1 Tax=Bacillus sp. USDA818B3_A TaxID=2698834 RepID=UPI001368DFA4
MGIQLLLLSTLMWSFVSIFVKAASFSLDSYTITFFRFSLGVVFLLLFIFISKTKFKITWKSKWIWYGVVGKTINYLFENYGVSIGHAYEQILVIPFYYYFHVALFCFLFQRKNNLPLFDIGSILCIRYLSD